MAVGVGVIAVRIGVPLGIGIVTLAIQRLKEAKDRDQREKQRIQTLKKELELTESIHLDIALKESKQNELARVEKIQEIKESAKKKGIDTINFYNIGVVGESGVGKSSLVNALVKNDKAVEPSIIEGIGELRNYEFPEVQSTQIWDVPGGGTTKIPMHEYFEKMSLFCFDCLIIVVGNRIKEWDKLFLTKSIEYDLGVVLVRSKSDSDINDIAEKRYKLQYRDLEEAEKGEVTKEARSEIEKYFQNELSSSGLGRMQYCYVSSMAMTRNKPDIYPYFDEERLKSDVIKKAIERKNTGIDIDKIEIKLPV